MHTYLVLVDDNFHHMDEGEQYELGEFATCAEAVAACKRVIDDFLDSNRETPRSQDELWNLFTTFGDSPLIVTADRECRFSAWEYATLRCEELAQVKDKQ